MGSTRVGPADGEFAPEPSDPHERLPPMADLKRKGDLAELMVAADLRRRGNRILFPYGEDCDYDLVASGRTAASSASRSKYTTSDGEVVQCRCRSHSLTNGRVRADEALHGASIDWLAVYDVTTERCFYVPASELGEGRCPPPPPPRTRPQRPALGVRSSRGLSTVLGRHGGVVLTGTRGVCNAELGVRFPPPPLVREKPYRRQPLA